MTGFSISETFGINADIIILALLVVVIILLILIFLNISRTSKLEKAYRVFMRGNDGESLEDNLIKRLNQIDDLTLTQEILKKKMNAIDADFENTFQKVGMVKYDAFNEMGGKLSFSVALLNRKNDGFIINAMHSREGCYTYIKEVVNGNSVIMLSDEEKEALDMALNYVEAKEPAGKDSKKDSKKKQ